MSWHLPHRLTHIHHMVSIVLLYSLSSAVLLPIAQAATMGKITVTSAQHEPLAASITMTDIRSASLMASLANPVVYQQMGLIPTPSMSVRFIPTSATTGQLLIHTAQPVVMPFADMVLVINNNGRRHLIPKTLLMPLNDNIAIKPLDRETVGTQQPSLSALPVGMSKSLTITRGTPPPLFAAPSLQIPLQAQKKVDVDVRDLNNSSILHATRVTTLPPLETSQTLGMANVIAPRPQIMKATKIQQPTNRLDNNINVQDNSLQAVGTRDKPFDLLTIKVTRYIHIKNRFAKSETLTSEVALNTKIMVSKSAPAESIPTSKNLEITSGTFSSSTFGNDSKTSLLSN
ncbi:hypothetical protein [Psychrobacter sp. CAL346-MNA-CIBAN-0220]|uniref:type IV pilus assembly protein FimV n=1 Tax=Psychrobacter sp. CAL346-MNA-CIBAN-0220 TaxID=3140457 RepID=UPI003329C104